MPFPRQNIQLVGNLGRDAEMRYTPSGQPVTSFSLAVTRQWGQGDQKQKETAWFNVSVWGDLAETCTSLTKGQQVMVIGYLKPDPATGRPRIWNGQDGSPGASYELTAQEVWLSMFKSTGNGQPASRNQTTGDEFPMPPEDDIPF